MATLKQLKTAVNKAGATMERTRSGLSVDITIDAPDGKVWNATAASCICESWYTDIPKMYDELIKMINEGFEDQSCIDGGTCEPNKKPSGFCTGCGG